MRSARPRSKKEIERRRVLAALDLPALRAWLARYGFGAQGDDDTLLRSAHEARVTDPATPAFLRRESVRWLREHAPESAALEGKGDA